MLSAEGGGGRDGKTVSVQCSMWMANRFSPNLHFSWRDHIMRKLPDEKGMTAECRLNKGGINLTSTQLFHNCYC